MNKLNRLRHEYEYFITFEMQITQLLVSTFAFTFGRFDEVGVITIVMRDAFCGEEKVT